MKKISSFLLLITIAIAVYAGMRWAMHFYENRQINGNLIVAQKIENKIYDLGNFQVQIQRDKGSFVRIVAKSSPQKILWQSVPKVSFVGAAQGEAKVKEARGSFFVNDEIKNRCFDQKVEKIEFVDGRLSIIGYLLCQSDKSPYTFVIKPYSKNQLAFDLSFKDEKFNRSYLTYSSTADESIFGFGEQFTFFDLKGKKLPILVMEQGIGRGAEPITTGANLMADSGGDWHTSYAGVPHYITSKLRSLFLTNYEYMTFDMRKPDRIQIAVHAGKISGNIIFGNSPSELIYEYTNFAGRMQKLPDWIISGAIIGMQGGTQKVKRIYQQFKELGTPMSGFWLQDWVGQRKTSFGKQLWWNWELDRDRYPNWDQLVADLKKDNVSILSYINPFLADVSEKKNHQRNLFQEASKNGYLIKDHTGKPYMILNTSFSAGLIDLTNPKARTWIKEIIKQNLIGSGAAGWMADFGEALPFDSYLHSGISAAIYHNQYPEEWARVNKEAIQEAKKDGEIVFFSRSGFTRSPRYSSLFWLGDQLVSWDYYDGIKTAVIGLLSSGLSGYALNHSDIGGYTTINNPIKDYHRSRELMLRWIELNAFSVIFRSHEGNRPDENHQIYSDPETMRFFSRFAKIFHAWNFYRQELVAQAAQTGLPVVRHLFIHYPNDENVYKLSYEQFLIGEELLMAPVLDPKTDSVRVYLPKGKWVHIWTKKEFGSKDKGVFVEIAAPIGKPAVFYKKGSAVGKRFVQNLSKAKVF